MYRAPVSAIQQTLIVSWFSIDILDKDRDHVFVGVSVEMMDFVAFVEQIGKSVWWWRVDNSGRDDVWHVSEVTVFRDTKFWI